MMSVCYYGTYESQYPRNRVFIKGLKSQGIAVSECHVPLWELEEHKGASFGFSISFLVRYLIAQLRLLWKFMTLPHADVIIIGYIGHLDVFSAWLLAKMFGAKLIFNPLVSLFDTVVSDRNFLSKTSLKGRLLLWLDQVACKLSDIVILDTEEHIRFFKEELKAKDTEFRRIWVGADDEVFKASGLNKRDDRFDILFIGKFIPLHGLSKVIEMASLLKSYPDIHFTVVGTGQLHAEIHALAQSLQLTNTRFIEHVPYEELGEAMETADLVLGIFGDSDKARRVIPNKLYQALAMGRAVLTVDSPAARELLIDGETAFLCEADPEIMAKRVLQIKADEKQRTTVAENGLALFQNQLNIDELGKLLITTLRLDLNE